MFSNMSWLIRAFFSLGYFWFGFFLGGGGVWLGFFCWKYSRTIKNMAYKQVEQKAFHNILQLSHTAEINHLFNEIPTALIRPVPVSIVLSLVSPILIARI